MDRRLSNASNKLRSLKELLSSTRSLNQRQHNSSSINLNNKNVPSYEKENRGSKSSNSVSLFNLLDPPMVSSRPMSDHSENEIDGKYPHEASHFSRHIPNKSVSMYGLSSVDQNSMLEVEKRPRQLKNPALRLFHTIRSKFRKRKKDTNKIVAKTGDLGSFLSDTSDRLSSVNAISTRSSVDVNVPRYQLNAAHSVEDFLVYSRSNDYSDVVSLENKRNSIDDQEVNFHNSMGHSSSLDLPLLHERSFTDGSERTSEDYTSGLGIEESAIVPEISQISTEKTRRKCLTRELSDLLHFGWYWGGLSKNEAEEKLKDQVDGAFVVRDSSSDHYLLSLSFNSNGRTLHARIEYRNGQFCFYSSEADSFPTVSQLIDHFMISSESGAFCYSKARRFDLPSYPVRLTTPISRFTEVKSLLYLSRFVIRQSVRKDLIPDLPLPHSLIQYVNEQRYIY